MFPDLFYMLKKATYTGLVVWKETQVEVSSSQYEGFITQIHGTTVTIFSEYFFSERSRHYAISVSREQEKVSCSTSKKLLDVDWIVSMKDGEWLKNLASVASGSIAIKKGPEPWIGLEFYLSQRLSQEPTLVERIKTLINRL